MYIRFLKEKDYLESGAITKMHLDQLINANAKNSFIGAEESAEMEIVGYLYDNYKIEETLKEGKATDYESRITYPKGAHFWLDDEFVEVLKPIAGRVIPEWDSRWSRIDVPTDEEKANSMPYSQFEDYYLGEIVDWEGLYFKCTHDNGYTFGISRPYQTAGLWTPDYSAPDTHEEYNPEKLDYAVGDFVSFKGHSFQCASTEVNGEQPVVRTNVKINDIRNKNVKLHMVRIALFELMKGQAANNIPATIVNDYERTVTWLENCSKGRVRPMIPRRSEETENPLPNSWAVDSFGASNPRSNRWFY